MTDRLTKTVVLGFDALDFDYLDAFRDDLENFPRLRSRGVEGALRSTHPPWTGSAWPSVYTGTDPSYHGIYAFFEYGHGYPESAELISRNEVRVPAIWNYLTALDKPSITMNVPVTHPAEPVEGILIPGYLANEEASGYPDGIRAELSNALGEPYRIYSEHETADDDRKKLAGFVDLIDQRRRAARYLLENYDWQVAMIQVQKTDTVFHDFSERDAFRRVYEKADELLGTVLDTVGEANVVVCSDHGIGPADGYQIYVNEILRQEGLLEATTDAERPTLSGVKGELLDGRSSGKGQSPSVTEQAIRSTLSSLKRIGVSPGQLFQAAKAVGAEPLVRRLLPSGIVAAVEENVDWRASTAYARLGSELGVRINLQGREPHGVVPQSEYETVRSEVIDTLSDLKTPAGEPAFEFVRRREEVYDGPCTDQACDVVFMPAGMNHAVLTNLFGKRFIKTEGYEHKPQGTFIAAGPSFDATSSVEGLALPDVAPIILGAAGYQVPERMSGSVPPGLLERSPTRTTYDDVQWGTGEPSSVADDAVEERLGNLGYMQ